MRLATPDFYAKAIGQRTIEQAPRAQMKARLPLPDSLDNSIDNLQWEPASVLGTSSILICPPIGVSL